MKGSPVEILRVAHPHDALEFRKLPPGDKAARLANRTSTGTVVSSVSAPTCRNSLTADVQESVGHLSHGGRIFPKGIVAETFQYLYLSVRQGIYQ
jgi:hypothetical protein